jgi:ABC-type sugar transport system ATPase subunit
VRSQSYDPGAQRAHPSEGQHLAGDNPASAVLLKCIGVSRYFGAVRALADVNLEVRQHEVVALVGDNGAGKSTLAKIISGIHRPDSGEIWLRGQRFKYLTSRQARELGIETVHQQSALCDNLDAACNVVLGSEPVKFRIGPFKFIDRKQAVIEAQRSLSDLGTRIDGFDIPVRRFSGGQRQAISVARASVRGGQLMVFDEPTAALGVRQKRTTLDLVRRVAERGMGAILISHNLDEVFEVSDRVVVLRLGRVVLEGDAREMSREQAVGAMTGLRLGG